MMRPAVVPPSAPTGERLLTMDACASTVGKRAERAPVIAACAWR